MDLVETEVNQELQDHIEGYIPEASLDHSSSLDCTVADVVDEDSHVHPRLGDQYQAEIPSLITECERLQLSLTAPKNDAVVGADNSVGKGLAIPIMWVQHEGNYIRQVEQQYSCSSISAGASRIVDYTCKGVLSTAPEYNKLNGYPSESLQNHATSSQGLTCKVELQDKLSSQDCETTGDQMFVGLGSLQTKIAEAWWPVPGSPTMSWSEAESQIFLLGLYIFGKNLVQITKFVDSKEMGDVLSFYYGKFYRSIAYRRWWECRKMRSRRCIYGQRIFTGWRQQVLHSRLLPSIAKEDQDNLVQATKMFSEGVVPFEDYIFTLKAMVGSELLIKAVGIGKGKHDLTGIVNDPFRTNQATSVRPEIPVGKACSSLTSGDIIKFLTGDFRLSKARSNDLFWEAVWPRLLARGWHSEQPKDLSSVGSKNSLVFLIPGVKKFSRRKLDRGNQYFDSISDVLNKVASDPRLLELEVEEANGSSSNKGQYTWNISAKMDQNGQPDQQQNCSLRPKPPNCNSEFMKFTVVDTSLIQGEGPCKVRELKTLPIDANCSIGPCNSSGDANRASSSENTSSTSTTINENAQYEPVIADSKELGDNTRCTTEPLLNTNGESYPVLSDEKILGDNSMTMVPGIYNPINPLSMGRTMVRGQDSNNEHQRVFHNYHVVKDTSSQSSYCFDSRSTQPKFIAPVSKRRKLTDCKYSGTGRCSYSLLRSHQLKKAETKLNSCNMGQIIGAETGPSWGKISSDSSVKYTQDQDNDLTRIYRATETFSETMLSGEKVQSRALIDLNLPHIPADVETVDPLTLQDLGNEDKVNGDEPPFPSQTQQQQNDLQSFETSNVMHSLHQPTMKARRQSTRSRPLTAKALEAFASEFFDHRRRGRSTTSRSSRRARRNFDGQARHPTGLGFTTQNEGVLNVDMNQDYGIHANQASIFGSSFAQAEMAGTHELFQLPSPHG